MMIDVRRENGKIYLGFSYNAEFKNALKSIGAKWIADTKEWMISEKLESQANNFAIAYMGEPLNGGTPITVEYRAEDFEFCGIVQIGEIVTVERPERDSRVNFLRDTIQISGENFPSSGGSRANPRVESPSDTVLQTVITQELYDSLPEDKQSLLKVISTAPEKEQLEKRKEALLAELAEIEAKLQAL